MVLKRKRTMSKKRKTTKSLVSKKAVDREIRKVANEVVLKNKPLKFTYNEYSTNMTNSAVIVEPILWPAQSIAAWNNDESDTSYSGRIGNEIILKKIVIEMELNAESSGGFTTNYCRVIVFQWLMDTQYENPIVGDILLGVPGSYEYLTPLNPINSQKYKILMDKRFILVNDCSNQTQKHTFSMMHFPVKKIRFGEDATNGFAANIVKGSIFMILCSDSGAIPHPTYTHNVLMQFSDSGY